MNPELLNREFILRFVEEKQRLVFWHDENREFTDYLEAGLPEELADVQILEVEKLGAFSTKLKLEREDTEGQFLIYTHGTPQESGNDWLQDVRLYSDTFQADKADLWLRELGLDAIHIDYVRRRNTFFNSKQRREKFRSAVSQMPGEGKGLDIAEGTQEFDRILLAVISKAEDVAVLDIFQQQLDIAHMEDGASLATLADLDLFEKYGVADSWWQWVQKQYGYSSESPNCADLLRKLLVTDFLASFEDGAFPTIRQFQLPGHRVNNVQVALDAWRNSYPRMPLYRFWAGEVAEELKLQDLLSDDTFDWMNGNSTFEELDKALLLQLRRELLKEPRDLSSKELFQVTDGRTSKFWCRPAQGDAFNSNEAAFRALQAGCEFFDELSGVSMEDRETSAEKVLQRYQSEFYRIDQKYRQFWYWEQIRSRVSQSNPLRELGERINQRYQEDYLQPLARGWSEHLESGFLDQWSTKELGLQRDFFSQHVEGSGVSKTYVIISDALRYEAGVELKERLEAQSRRDVEMEALLSSVPSYTQLGMASLLPHQQLEIQEDANATIKADGHSTVGLANRSKILESKNGHAIHAIDFLKMSQAQAREFHKDHDILYIYQDIIDAQGESKEEETFLAVEEALDEIVQLIDFCVNRLNASKILVTSDHGFLFRMAPPEEEDRATVEVPHGVTKKHKRFFLGKSLGSTAGAIDGKVAKTAGVEGDWEFWVPKGANRFYFTGGARFTHGGAMPQEVVIPLLKVSYNRSESLETQYVKVHVEGDQHRITTQQHKFTLTQLEAVSETRHPVRLKVFLVDVADGGKSVSTIEEVALDSASGELAQRQKEIWLTLESGATFDRQKEYALVLRDAETDKEHDRISVTIDRSFEDDF